MREEGIGTKDRFQLLPESNGAVPHPDQLFQLVRGAYLGMNVIGWTVIFPLSLASLLSGVIQAIGTVWGLFRHYWVLIKLLITTVATALLLLHLQPVTRMAEVASTVDLGPADMTGMRAQLVVDAGAALVVLPEGGYWTQALGFYHQT